MEKKNTITVEFEPKFRHGEIAYCIFCKHVCEVKVAGIYCNCQYDTKGDGASEKSIEYKVYDESMRCYYLISEFRIFATKDDAENYLLNAR